MPPVIRAALASGGIDYTKQLIAATVEHVVILPDNDNAGRNHAAQVAASCHAAGLKVKIVTLPDLPLKGDISDWLDAGRTKAELVALVKAAPLYTGIQQTPPSYASNATEPGKRTTGVNSGEQVSLLWRHFA
jgi:putative DNA primase/helicase